MKLLIFLKYLLQKHKRRFLKMDIYVGNLSFDASEDDVRGAFAPFGTVESIKMIMDRETGRPRGFAFVEMEDPAAADAAIQALDGSDFGGRNLRVNEAQERRGGGGRR